MACACGGCSSCVLREESVSSCETCASRVAGELGEVAEVRRRGLSVSVVPERECVRECVSMRMGRGAVRAVWGGRGMHVLVRENSR
eukprot:181971-Chlamydomonas_euryale.AAC.2